MNNEKSVTIVVIGSVCVGLILGFLICLVILVPRPLPPAPTPPTTHKGVNISLEDWLQVREDIGYLKQSVKNIDEKLENLE